MRIPRRGTGPKSWVKLLRGMTPEEREILIIGCVLGQRATWSILQKLLEHVGSANLARRFAQATSPSRSVGETNRLWVEALSGESEES